MPTSPRQRTIRNQLTKNHLSQCNTPRSKRANFSLPKIRDFGLSHLARKATQSRRNQLMKNHPSQCSTPRNKTANFSSANSQRLGLAHQVRKATQSRSQSGNQLCHDKIKRIRSQKINLMHVRLSRYHLQSTTP